jgi:hypothetical protein
MTVRRRRPSWRFSTNELSGKPGAVQTGSVRPSVRTEHERHDHADRYHESLPVRISARLPRRSLDGSRCPQAPALATFWSGPHIHALAGVGRLDLGRFLKEPSRLVMPR